jgi:hypothetical protein
MNTATEAIYYNNSVRKERNIMPRLNQVGTVPVIWDHPANRYTANDSSKLSAIYDRLKPVLDPMVVTMGPGAMPGGKYPWEGNDPATGRRYVARKLRDREEVSLEEVID